MTLPVPEDLSIFKKHSFPKQGSSPGKEHHDPRPLSGREWRSAQRRIPQGAPSVARFLPLPSVSGSRITGTLRWEEYFLAHRKKS